MKQTFILLLALILPVCSLYAQRAPTKPILIRNVTIIDCTAHAPQSAMSVLIADGRIQVIKPSSKFTAPPDAQIVEGQSKYLIPGLWNMHVHLGAYANGKHALADFLAQGITGVRDMASPLDDILRLRSEVENGTILGPQMVVAGPIVQGPLPFQMPMFISVKDAATARQTVTMLHTRGVDFIKVQDAIPHDIYVAVAQQAASEHIPFAGHIPPTVLPEEASNLGQRSIEHMGGRFWGLLLGASLRESELHGEELQMYSDILGALERKETSPSANMRAQFLQEVVDSYDDKKAAALVALLRKNGTWQCPTLVALQNLWSEEGTQYSREDIHWSGLLLEKETKLVALMQKAGVGLLAGTDLPANAKGGTIHDELEALVDAGLTPLQALQTATRRPAEFLGKLDSEGTVEQGKSANLVLLDGNPLGDISNTRRIVAVIVKGHVIQRGDQPQP